MEYSKYSESCLEKVQLVLQSRWTGTHACQWRTIFWSLCPFRMNLKLTVNVVCMLKLESLIINFWCFVIMNFFSPLSNWIYSWIFLNSRHLSRILKQEYFLLCPMFWISRSDLSSLESVVKVKKVSLIPRSLKHFIGMEFWCLHYILFLIHRVYLPMITDFAITFTTCWCMCICEGTKTQLL